MFLIFLFGAGGFDSGMGLQYGITDPEVAG
jgi:hypothetical protein